MTAVELLTLARKNGIVLEAQGEKLIVDAPVGILTDELRRHLCEQKPALLELLTPSFVTLIGGLTVPRPALELALSLEGRGVLLRTDADHQFIVPNDPRLTAADYVAIDRWRQHLGAIVEYRAPEVS